MSDHLPAFHDLYVISDLHMGGEPGFQILRETERLAGFIRRLAGEPLTRRVALVLNGDVIDTLAEARVKGYVAMLDAVDVVAAIIDRSAFKPVWDSLAEFVQTENRHLMIVIGNHDVELALPAVQRMLAARLIGDKPAARAQLEFSTTGGGYPCTVGGARVFCTHGNETDAWNFNSYEELARLGRRVELGRTLEEWHPNAGTRLVKEVMNEVKRRFAWIDLLKPEKSAAFGTLLALDPGRIRKLPDVATIVPAALDTRERDRRLNEQLAAKPLSDSERLDQLLGPNLRALRHATPRPTTSAEAMLLSAEDALGAPPRHHGPAGRNPGHRPVHHRPAVRLDHQGLEGRGATQGAARLAGGRPQLRLALWQEQRRPSDHRFGGHELPLHHRRPHPSGTGNRSGRRTRLLQLGHLDPADEADASHAERR